MKNWSRIAAGTVAALALAGVGTGVALADTTTPPTPSSTGAASPGGHHHGRLRGEHGEITRHTAHGDVVVDLQRGVVAAVNPTSVTVRSTDGFTQTYALNAQTKVRKEKQSSAIDQIAAGDRIGVVALRSGTDLTARAVHDRGPAPSTAPTG